MILSGRFGLRILNYMISIEKQCDAAFRILFFIFETHLRIRNFATILMCIYRLYIIYSRRLTNYVTREYLYALLL